MSLRTLLNQFVKVVSDEAERNPEFAKRLRSVFKLDTVSRPVRSVSIEGGHDPNTNRPANRRAAAVLDPVALATQGEEALRSALQPLTLEQLKDIVADYGMDHKRLVMKWKSTDRVIDNIVEVSVSRARKGDAFRS